jgi:hypothetical protein
LREVRQLADATPTNLWWEADLFAGLPRSQSIARNDRLKLKTHKPKQNACFGGF